MLFQMKPYVFEPLKSLTPRFGLAWQTDAREAVSVLNQLQLQLLHNVQLQLLHNVSQ